MMIDYSQLYKADKSLEAAKLIFQWIDETLKSLGGAAENKFAGRLFLDVKDRPGKFEEEQVIAHFSTPFGNGRVVIQLFPISGKFYGQFLNAKISAETLVGSKTPDVYETVQVIRVYQPEGIDESKGWVASSES